MVIKHISGEKHIEGTIHVKKPGDVLTLTKTLNFYQQLKKEKNFGV